MSLDDISSKLTSIIQEEIDNVLKSISSKYKIDYTELQMQYIKTKPQQVKEESPKKPAPQKRGRKKKEKEEFIETEEYEYDGIIYLIDKKNVVYTNNTDAHVIVGERLVDGTIKFYK